MSFVPTRFGLEHSRKNSMKILKIKKYHSDFISSQIGLGQAEKETKKFRFEFRSYPIRFRASPKKLQKN